VDQSNSGGPQAAVNLSGSSKIVVVIRGCPQGGVLSTLLWCLVVEDLIARLNGGGIYAQGYVDVVCLSGKFPNTVYRDSYHKTETWCNEIRLSVKPQKTEPVVFTRRRKLPNFFEPHFFGVTLLRSKLVKHLGVFLDSQLTWREHVDVKVRRAHNMLWTCQRAYGAS
jgi:hypothetical protein